MQYAFEITVDDVAAVMGRMGCGSTERADELHAILDMDTVVNAALWADDMDDQTEYAYDEIEKQLKKLLRGVE